MALSGFLFISWRIFEIIITVPIVGMLAWFVHQFVRANAITPDDILVLFIVSVLALAWTFFTLISYLRARHDAIFVALVDLAFVGAFIGGVVVLRYIADADCSSSDAGYTSTGFWLNFNINKQCAMRKAAFALGIIDILAFFVTFVSSSDPDTLRVSANPTTAPRAPRPPQPPQRRRGLRQAHLAQLTPRPPPLAQPRLPQRLRRRAARLRAQPPLQQQAELLRIIGAMGIIFSESRETLAQELGHGM